jgi:hypothetical protein
VGRNIENKVTNPKTHEDEETNKSEGVTGRSYNKCSD